MTNDELAFVQQIPLLFLPVGAFLMLLAWRAHWWTFGLLHAGCFAVAVWFCFGTLIGRHGHGAGWDGMAGIIYFGMFLAEFLSISLVAVVFALAQRRAARGG